MQDEQFIREWTEVHEDFTSDLQCTLNQLGAYQRSRGSAPCVIGPAYDAPRDADPGPALSPAAQASLRGLAASVITLALWVVVMLVATPTPGFAATREAAPEPPACVAPAMLA
jgi:hypothetical protein